MPALSVSTAAVTAIDISNGFRVEAVRNYQQYWNHPWPGLERRADGGPARLPRSPQSTTTTFRVGNRNADAGGWRRTAILSTNGGPPWTSVTLASPAGIAAGKTIAHDINNLRVLVGKIIRPNRQRDSMGQSFGRTHRPTSASPSIPGLSGHGRSINNNNVIVGLRSRDIAEKSQSLRSARCGRAGLF
jgi:hypothetical protein